MENQNSVKWGKPVEISGGGLTYTSKCGRFMITKKTWYSARHAQLRASYAITVVATGMTHGCTGLAGGRKWAEHLAAQVAL